MPAGAYRLIINARRDADRRVFGSTVDSASRSVANREIMIPAVPRYGQVREFFDERDEAGTAFLKGVSREGTGHDCIDSGGTGTDMVSYSGRETWCDASAGWDGPRRTWARALESARIDVCGGGCHGSAPPGRWDLGRDFPGGATVSCRRQRADRSWCRGVARSRGVRGVAMESGVRLIAREPGVRGFARAVVSAGSWYRGVAADGGVPVVRRDRGSAWVTRGSGIRVVAWGTGVCAVG
jgi:hypothetical protein